MSEPYDTEIQALRDRINVLETALGQANRVQQQWQHANVQLQEAQQALVESRDRFLALFEHASNGMVIASMKGEIQVMNPEALQSFGYDEEQQPANIHDIFPEYETLIPQMQDRRRRHHSTLISRLHEVRMLRYDGSWLDADIALICIVLRGEPLLLLTIQDISRQIEEREQHHIEQQELQGILAKRAHHLLQLSRALEATRDPMVIVDTEGVVEYANPAYFRMWGYTSEQVLGSRASILKSGEQNDAFYAAMWQQISDGHEWEGRLTNRCQDGKTKAVSLSISPIVENDKIVNFIGVYRDLTEQEFISKQVLQTQKMEAISTLVSGISHEFNNILAGMTGNLYLAKMLYPDDEEITRYLDSAETQGFKAAEMIQKLMVFARKDWVEEKEIDLNEVIEETGRMGRFSIPENIDFNIILASEPLMVRADAAQLQQMLLHLIQNSHDALKHGKHGKIILSLEPWEGNSNFLLQQNQNTARHFARICIKDNGIGISDKDLPHIFEPFYTNKDTGEGTGLGLSAVFGVIERLGGTIEPSSQPGNTCFEIFIPVIHQAEEVIASDDTVDNKSKESNPVVLLVDDEADVLAITAKILASLGFKVVEAHNGLQAAEYFEQHSEDIDIVVSDIIMPQLGGIDAVKRMRRIRKNLPAVFITGYDQEYFEQQVTEDSLTRLTLKPLRIGELSKLIRELLA